MRRTFTGSGEDGVYRVVADLSVEVLNAIPIRIIQGAVSEYRIRATRSGSELQVDGLGGPLGVHSKDVVWVHGIGSREVFLGVRLPVVIGVQLSVGNHGS